MFLINNAIVARMFIIGYQPTTATNLPFSFNVDLFQNVNVNNGTLVQYLVIERVICFYILRLQELKQEQELAFVSIPGAGAGVGVCFLGAGVE